MSTPYHPPTPTYGTPAPAPPREARPGDLVHWSRQRTKGAKTVTEAGYGVVCELGRGHASIWPLSGPVVRRLTCDLVGVTVLIEEADLLAELARRHRETGR